MDEEIKKMIEENLRLTQEIHDMTHKIKNYITFQKIMSMIYFILIVGPIILGIIYLPPLLKNLVGQYESVLGAPSGSLQSILGGVKSGVQDDDTQKILDSLKK